MEYVAEAVQEEGLRFAVKTGQHALVLDYPLDPALSGAGPRPLEMLLGSLSACAGSSLVLLLKRRNQPLRGLKVLARGQRRSEHPTVFTGIALEFIVSGPVEEAAVAQAISQAETTICPIWAMLRPSTPITSSFRIEA